MTATDCAGKFTLKCPFDNSKIFCTGNTSGGDDVIENDGSGTQIDCVVGSVLYNDLQCYTFDNVPEDKTAIAVVFDATNKRAIGLNDASSLMAWYSDSTSTVQATAYATADAALAASSTGNSGGSGSYATNIYSTKNSGLSTSFAPYYCYMLTSGGSSNWFLPSLKELKAIYDNKTTINDVLDADGDTALSGNYWSSNKLSGTDSGGGYSAWIYNMTSTNSTYEAYYEAYTFTNKVRCAIRY